MPVIGHCRKRNFFFLSTDPIEARLSHLFHEPGGLCQAANDDDLSGHNSCSEVLDRRDTFDNLRGAIIQECASPISLSPE